jgi:hypothetical protein
MSRGRGECAPEQLNEGYRRGAGCALKYKKNPKKAAGKERRGVPKASKLVEIGD